MNRLLTTTVLVLSAVIGTWAAESDDNTKTKFIEPIITEETLPNEPKELTLQFGTDYRQRNGETNAMSLPYLEVFYGLVDRLGIVLNVPMAYHSKGDDAAYGLGDISVSPKYLVVPPNPIVPAVVFGLEARFPTGNEHLKLGSGALELTPFVALLKEVGPFLVQGNIGWSKQVTAQQKDAWVYNWAVSTPLYQRRLYLLTEINGDWASPNHAAISPGVKYFVSETFAFGTAVPIGLNRHTETWGVVTQFEFEF